jgi:hypothetical protein
VEAAKVEQQRELPVDHLVHSGHVPLDEARRNTRLAALRRAITSAAATMSMPVTCQPCRAK